MNTTFNFHIILALLACFAMSNLTYAQVGVNTTAPEGAMHLNTSTQGLVYPRVALSSTIVEAPVVNTNGPNLAVGTTVYNTYKSQTGANDVYPGLYVWDGAKWVGQFIREDYSKFDQTALVRPTRRSLTTASTVNTNSDGITGLVNQTFTPKYSGIYKIMVSTNFAAGQINNYYAGNLISMGSTEGDFVFFFSQGATNIIDPTANIETFADGWIYMHAYGVYNDIEGVLTEGIPHYSSVVYTEYLTADMPYTFSLRVNNYTYTNFPNTLAGQGYVGRDLPCSVEFTYVDD